MDLSTQHNAQQQQTWEGREGRKEGNAEQKGRKQEQNKTRQNKSPKTQGIKCQGREMTPLRVLFSTHLEQIVPGLWEDTKGSEWVWVMAQWVKGNYEDLSLNPWCSYKDTDVVMDIVSTSRSSFK